jgi:hypothetical protein
MIKFFRKIRQNLLMENKTGKYFKYAIGEILLVVIGILIALAINNWNEKRKELNQTVELLKNMMLDLKADISNLESDINYYNQWINSSRVLLNTNEYQLFSTDSIYNLLPTNNTVTKVTNQTFEKIKNAGITKILDSDHLLDNISYYYTDLSNNLDALISWDFEYTLKATDFWRLDDYFEAPILNDTILTPFTENDSIRKNTFIELMLTIKSKNHIRYAISRKLNLLNSFKFIKAESEDLIKMIEQELGNVDLNE